MKEESNSNWTIQHTEPGNRPIVHVFVNPGMMASNRSQAMCYYYFGDFERTGRYEMIASDRGNEDYIENKNSRPLKIATTCSHQRH